jgi:hypothetical protein
MSAEQISMARTGLLIVDLQNDFLHSGGAYARGGQGAASIAALPARLKPLAEAFRARGGWIISTHFTLVPGKHGEPLISPHLMQLRPFLRKGDFLPGGLYVGGAAHFVVSNNIVWDNLPEQPGPFQNDFQGASSHDRYSNDIGVVSSNTVDGEVVGELSVDPQFAPCGFLCIGFELERGSPLVDAGVDDPAGGQTATDLAGKPRTIGPHVDIGAYENDLLFADGFD